MFACGERGGCDENSEPQLVHRVCALRHRVQGLPVVNVEEGDEDEELIPDPGEPAGVTEDEGEDQEDLHVPLDDQVYIGHVARGHQPYLPSCSLCVSSRGVIPARRRCDPKIPQASFLSDFLFFTKDLRVCLIQHELSGYLIGIPYATGEEPTRVVKQICAEMHYCMKGQHVVLRMDNEHSLQSLWNKAARDKSFPGLSLHIDSVAKGRPQQKGQVEVGVRHFKEAFWVRSLLASRLQAAGLGPEVEKPGLLLPRLDPDGAAEDGVRRASGRRPADVWVANWGLHGPAAFDLAVTSGIVTRTALQQTMRRVSGLTWTPSPPARKRASSSCPVVEASGGWAPVADRTWKELGSLLAARSGEPVAEKTLRLRQCLAVTLQRESARAVLRRLGSPDGAGSVAFLDP